MRTLAVAWVLIFAASLSARAQANFPVFTDTLVNSFQDWSYGGITRSITNASPVHSGSYSINVTITSSGGTLQLHSPNFSTAPYANLSFWINGGAAGGQKLKVYGLINGSGQAAYVLPALATNIWVQYTIPLSSLGVANNANFNGILIQDNLGAAQSVFYVDDIQLGAAPAPALVHLAVNAANTVRKADARWFGVNLATWDGNLGNAATEPFLKQAGILALRLPGGSGADLYHWANNASQNGIFYQTVTNLGANSQALVTVNYGSGTASEAAGWVNDANLIHHCGIKYWEIGNECYGTWETDNNTYPWDPYTYAVRAAQYMTAMRAIDPTIKIGVVAVPGDDADSNGYTSHSAYNSRTGQYHNGWVPVMLTTLKNLGVRPDFLIHHVYPQGSGVSPPGPSGDSDPLILQYNNWPGDAATLRQEISDYWGTGGTNIELCCTENNSDYGLGGKQLSSLVNGLYIADTLSKLMQTEINSYLWWDLRNGTGNNGDLDPSLYGWRLYGDEGIITGLNGLNPTYYAMKLMQYFVRPRDTVLTATSDYLLLSTYASYRSDGALNVLVINKDSITNFNGQFNISNFAVGTNAMIHSYGIPQDNAVRDSLSAALQDIAVTNYPAASNQFTYSFPPYSLTLFTFVPTNYLTLALAMPANVDWNTITNWSDGNAASVSAAANPFAVYDVLAGAIVRSPVAGGATFPGGQLIVNGDGNWVSGGSASIGEFRLKGSPVTVPWLQLNGGQLDVSTTGNSQSVLNGRLDILGNTPFFNDPANDEGLTVNSYLTGTGNVEWRDTGFSLANGKNLNVAGNTNTYSGTWNVIQGTLLCTGTNALGTNSITIGASGYLETTYDLKTTNGILTLNGKLLLHQNDTFKMVTVSGVQLAAGTYTFAQLNAAYPAYFPASWTLQNGSTVSTGSGSLTVLSVTPPAITVQPAAATTLYAGRTAQFSVTAVGGQPLSYQWRAGSSYTNLINGGNVSGVTNATLTITNVSSANAINYLVVVTNSGGAITSSVASLTIISPSGEPSQTAVLAASPAAFYQLNETANPSSGTAVAYDYVGGNNGTYGSGVQNGYNNIAGPRLVPDGLAGFAVNNYAANFTNNSGISQITLPAFNLNTNTVTLTAWLRPLAAQNSWAGIVFCRAGSTVAGLSYTSTQLNGNYVLGYNWNNDQNAYNWYSGLVAPTNQWSLVALTVSPTAATIYVINTNGVSSATHTYSHVVQNFDGVTLLGDDSADGGNGGRGFNGAVDNVAVFNRTLTLAQINSLFNSATAPFASFTASQTNGYAPVAVTFTDNSSGSITNRHWIFGDGSTLDTAVTSVTHTYAQGLSNVVTLILAGTGGAGTNALALNLASTPTNGQWTVNFCCVNTVNSDPGTPYVGAGILGSGTYWNPMPGVQSASASTTYRDDGATNSGGITFSGANVTGNYSGTLPYTIQLLNVYSYFTSAGGATFTFANVPNGTYNLALYGINGHWCDHQVMFTVNGVSQTLTSVQDKYFAPDNTCLYTNVVVTNNQLIVHMVGQGTVANPANTEGDFDGAQLQFVNPPPPVAGFSGTPTNLFVTQTVTFTNTSAGSITNAVWSFGDGNTASLSGSSAGSNVTETYTNAGSYVVQLIVSGAGGASTNTRVAYIVAVPLPVLGGVTAANGGLIFSGVNGPAGMSYRILAATNLAAPAWLPIWTNVFAPDGSYDYTNSTLTNPAYFFRLVSP
jgi:PKD repeat protein